MQVTWPDLALSQVFPSFLFFPWTHYFCFVCTSQIHFLSTQDKVSSSSFSFPVMWHIYCTCTYYTLVVTYGANYITLPIVAILVGHNNVCLPCILHCRGIVDTCGCHKVYSRLVRIS